MTNIAFYQINGSPPSTRLWASHLQKSAKQIARLNQQTIELIQTEYLASTRPWFVGFSGGKDSSALLKLLFQALKQIKNPTRTVTVIYCDTGVEIPIIRNLTHNTLNRLVEESRLNGVPIDIQIAQPALKDRYFVKVIGRGYPPPTNKFRWCTDRLRISPVRKVLDELSGGESTVLLGIRKGESAERDKTIRRHRTAGQYYFRQSNNSKVLIFSPIIEYSLEDVWATIQYQHVPTSIDARRLISLYKDASGECPIIRDPQGTPCGKGRFGCWTCTVVRKDRAMQSMINEGHANLKPLLKWRNWLMTIRDNPTYRSTRRRNGQPGLGPFTLRARREILRKLLAVQNKSSWTLISEQEIKAVKQLWKIDEQSASYTEIQQQREWQGISSTHKG